MGKGRCDRQGLQVGACELLLKSEDAGNLAFSTSNISHISKPTSCTLNKGLPKIRSPWLLAVIHVHVSFMWFQVILICLLAPQMYVSV